MKNFIIVVLGMILAMSACAKKKDYLVTIKTGYGDIKVILYDQTPKHKESFLKLAQNGDYDSTIFHRIIKDFMIQGGDVNAKSGNEEKINYTIPAEFVDTLFHHKGALAAARQGDNINPTKASGIQWYIVQGVVYSEDDLTTDMQKMNGYMKQLMQKPEYADLQEELTKIYHEQGQEAYGKKMMEMKPILEKEFNTTFEKEFSEDRLKLYTTIGGTPHLDDAYTVFGHVVEGLDVVDKIAGVKTAAMDKPVEDIFITMEVEQVNIKKLKKQYGI
jgi:peptidyl-prolyl cis-trans isomerase B (cyclophilin B)